MSECFQLSITNYNSNVLSASFNKTSAFLPIVRFLKSTMELFIAHSMKRTAQYYKMEGNVLLNHVHTHTSHTHTDIYTITHTLTQTQSHTQTNAHFNCTHFTHTYTHTHLQTHTHTH